MGYFIRVLSRTDEDVAIESIEEHLADNELVGKIELEEVQDGCWSRFIVSHENNMEICVVEKDSVIENSLGQEEIEEFLDEISDYHPKTAVQWLQEYLPNVKVIYSFQILAGAYESNGWDIIGAVKDFIWGSQNAIIQADNEGFTNEDGYQILWQFNDDVDGDWYMAVLGSEGEWIRFKMDLGNTEQRESFFNGEVPNGVSVIV